MVGIVCLILVLSGFCSSLLATFFLRLSTNPRKHIDSIIKILYLVSFLAFITISVQVMCEIHISFIILSIVFLGIGAFGLAPFNCEALEDLGKPIQEAISVNGFYFLINLIGLPLGFISTLPGEYLLNDFFYIFIQPWEIMVYGLLAQVLPPAHSIFFCFTGPRNPTKIRKFPIQLHEIIPNQLILNPKEKQFKILLLINFQMLKSIFCYIVKRRLFSFKIPPPVRSVLSK